MVLTYQHDQLAGIYSSTPSVQFVRLDLDDEKTVCTEAHDFALASPSRQLIVPALQELPEGQRRAVQRAFRGI